jgi:hypothetical protein
MSLSGRLSAILSRSRTEDIRQRDAARQVWDIGGPGILARRKRQRAGAVAACRAELLCALLAAEGPIFLIHHEPPDEYGVPGDWQRVGSLTWRLPAEFNVHDPIVERWLFTLGDWRLYCAPAPVGSQGPDVFRCSADELLTWMKANSVAVLIESFHDDSDWVVAIENYATLVA